MRPQTTLPERSPLSIRQSLRWIIGTRIVLLCSSLISTAVSSIFLVASEAERVSFLYTPLSALLGISAVAMLMTVMNRGLLCLAVSQVVLDALIITGIVYITGGPISPFLFLYIPFVFAITLTFGGRMTVMTVMSCAGAYLALVAGLTSDWIVPADGSARIALPSGGLYLQIIGLISALILVSVCTAYLARMFRSSSRLAKQSQEAFQRLKERQHQMIDSLNEGVITTDNALKIIGLNTTAEHLLSITESNALGQNLEALLENLNDSIRTEDLLNPSQTRFTMSLAQGGHSTHLLCERHPLVREDQEAIGYLFILQDVTKLKSIEDQLAAHERMARLLAEQQPGSESPESSAMPAEFIGETPIMRKVFSLIERVAQSEATVLIGGESGTGKELAARAIHQLGNRRNRPFIAVNCGAIPEHLIESELFGHRKGSFTGAVADHQGLFRQAEGGTLFLDEIGELPLQMQAKLLRVLQEKTLRPVGGDRDTPINVRIIGATNRNLKEEVSRQRFREDLFYRLNVISIMLPPLRERREDIPLLAQRFLSRMDSDARGQTISPSAMQMLLSYNYPGNVRELENVLERAIVLGGSVILPEHLHETLRLAEEARFQPVGQKETIIHVDESLTFPVDLDQVLSSLERSYLEGALAQSRGAKKKAASLLGVNMRSFRYRCQKYQIGEEEERE